MEAITEDTKLKSKLNDLAKSYAEKFDFEVSTLLKSIKSKIIKNGVPAYTLIRYLNGSNEPSLVNAQIIHQTLLEYDSTIQMSDIF